jgi:hypothetical protein
LKPILRGSFKDVQKGAAENTNRDHDPRRCVPNRQQHECGQAQSKISGIENRAGPYRSEATEGEGRAPGTASRMLLKGR